MEHDMEQHVIRQLNRQGLASDMGAALAVVVVRRSITVVGWVGLGWVGWGGWVG